MSVLPLPVHDPHETPSPDESRDASAHAPAVIARETPAPPLFPPLRALIDMREPYLIPLFLLVLTRGIFGALLPLASEDAYITFRYARNFAAGLGPVFNPGERVMGFTSPLWMVWNALGWSITHDPVGWSRLTALGADILTLLLAGSMLSQRVSRASAWCFTFAFASWIAFTGVAISGMENGVMIALVLLAAALSERKSKGAGFALAALAFIRPEGIAAAGLIAMNAKWRDRIVAIALMSIGFAILTIYFGSPLPQSVAAKAGIYGTPGPWVGRHWWEWAFPFALGRWPLVPDGRFLFLGTVLFAPAAFSAIPEVWRMRKTALGIATIAMLGVWLGYIATGVAYFFWYLVVPLAGWFLMVAIGLPKIVRGRALYVSAALLVLGCWSVVWELYAGRARAEESFGRVGDYLAANGHAGEKVLLEPIGIVGWRSKLDVLDEVGLVSPAIAERRRGGPGWMADVVAVEQPRWLVTRRGVLRGMEAFAGKGAPFRSAAERDAMLSHYAIAGIEDEASGDAALVVMRRRGI